MPSVEMMQKVMGNDWEVATDPMKPSIVIVEHKIRNLEKRKAKLDQYKNEQSQGKELNADQLTAVAKYSEVTHQLDLARDFVKQFADMSIEIKRQIKRDQKEKNLEKVAMMSDKIKQLLMLQALSRQMERTNYLPTLSQRRPKDTYCMNYVEPAIETVVPFLNPSFSTMKSEIALSECVEQVLNLIDGKPKRVNRVCSTTYQEVKDVMIMMAKSDNFFSAPVSDVVPDQPSENESVSSPVSNEPIIEPPKVPVVPIQESTSYIFLQESQIDIESPHMDPAVVAVSSFVPPPISQTTTDQRSAFTNSVMPEEIGSMGDGSVQIQLDNEISTWNGNCANKTGPPSKLMNHEINKDGFYNNGDNSNRFGSNPRGFRGGKVSRGRGTSTSNASNGYGRGPRGGNREYVSNDRIGHYRSDNQDRDYENPEYRGGRGGNSGGGSRRGNNRNSNSSRGGSGDGFRSFRGSRQSGGTVGKPPRTGNNGESSESY